MELYLDTADVAAVRRWSRILPLAGVTTNPSITAAGGMPLTELLPALREVLGPKARLFAQVMAKTETEMVREAFALRELDRDLVIKIPVCEEGLAAIKTLTANGVPTLGTAVYTPLQGWLAAVAGAEYVAPYVNRLDAQGAMASPQYRSCNSCWRCMRRTARCWRHRSALRARRLTACWRVASPSRCRSMWPNSCCGCRRWTRRWRSLTRIGSGRLPEAA